MEDSQHQTPTPESVTPVLETPVRKKTNIALFLIIGGVLLITCICLGLCVVSGGAGFVKAFQEREPAGEVIDSFMQAMAKKDTKEAFALFSSRAQRQMKMSDLEDMLQGNNYVLFEGYQRIEIGNFNISKGFNTNQNLPQGTIAKVNGTVYYDDGFTGTFDATLEKENGVWRLHGINITAPPDKFVPKTMRVQEQ